MKNTGQILYKKAKKINYFQKGQKCIIPKIGQVIFQKVQV